MNDLERRVAWLEQRLAWVERETTRMVYGLIAIVAFGAGALAYWETSGFGELIAFGCAVVAFLGVSSYLRRHHFKGAPDHVQDID